MVLGGPGVARGYLGAGPFGGRFATGDCGRWAWAGEVRVLEARAWRKLRVVESLRIYKNDWKLLVLPETVLRCWVGETCR